MAWVSIFGPTGLPIGDSLLMASDKVKELGQVIMEINMLEISVMIAKMVLENIFGLMAIPIREILVKI